MLGGNIVVAQYPDFYFTRISDYNNLASHYVDKMVQDDYGYIWIGTQNGLSRFDGYENKTYRDFYKSENLDLVSSQVDYLIVDSKNRIWASTPISILLYNRDLDYFESIANYQDMAGLPGIYHDCLLEDPNGHLIIAIDSALYRYNEESRDFSQIFKTPDGKIISSIIFDPEGGFWLGYENGGGVAYFNEYSDSVAAITFKNELDAGSRDFSIVDLERDGEYLWIAIMGGGIVRLNLETKEIRKFYADTAEKHVIGFYRDKEGNLWSSDYGGTKIYLPEEEYFHGYYYSDDYVGSVRPDLNGIFQDRQGNYYTYYNGEGVMVSPTQRGFRIFNTSDRFYWTTTNDNISAIHNDRYGNLWAGAFSGGLDIFAWENNEVVRIAPSENVPGKLGAGSVLVIFRDSSNRMWIGTHQGGIQLFNENDRSFKSWRHSEEDTTSIPGNDIRAIVEDDKGNLWIGTHGNGIAYFDIENDIFITYNRQNNKLSGDWVNDLLVDENGRVWVATSDGLSYLEKGSNVFISCYGCGENENVLYGNMIMCLLLDRNDQIWVGTNNGLYLFDEENDMFLRHDLDFANNYICSMEEDQNGDLWVATHGGLYRYNIETGETFMFKETDGLQGDGFNIGASYFNGKDEMFFGGSMGVNLFKPDDLFYNTLPPEIRFSRFLLFNKEINQYGKDEILKKEINSVNEVVLKYSQNFFTIEFVALNLINPNANQYAVILEGFDNEWVYIGDRRSASYTNLNPGTYNFRVKAANNDGKWNEEGISLRIRVLPPWYKTLWFYLGLILFLFTGVIMIFRIRTANLRKQKTRLVQLVSEQTKKLRINNAELRKRTFELNKINLLLEERQKVISEQAEEMENQAEKLQLSNEELLKLIETKDKLFSIIAHDLRTPFNTILGFSSLLIESSDDDDPEKLKLHARIVHDASMTVFNLLENLLYWTRTQTDDIHFAPQSVTLNDIVYDNLDLIKESSTKKEIEIDTKTYHDFPVYADVNMMRTVIRNFLINAIKFTPRGGRVSISSEKQNNKVCFYVKDTGVGMSPEFVDQILNAEPEKSMDGTEGEKGSGLGLLLCREFILKNNGDFYVESELNKGSSFGFSIPAREK